MRLPQVVIYETDGTLAGQVRRLAGEHSWLIRESRAADAVVKLLVESGPSVLLLKLERRLARWAVAVEPRRGPRSGLPDDCRQRRQDGRRRTKGRSFRRWHSTSARGTFCFRRYNSR